MQCPGNSSHHKRLNLAHALLWGQAICLVLSLFLSPSVLAQSTPLLWQVEDPATKVKAYLFGSMHYGADSFYPLPDSVMVAFKQSDTLMVELNIDVIDASHIQAEITRQGFYSDASTLSKHIGDDLWHRLSELCETLAFDPQAFSSMRPWLVAVQLLNRQLADSEFEQDLGLDNYFLKLAAKRKRIVELEQLSDQLQLFARLSEKDQIQFLQTTIDEYSQAQRNLRDLAEAWYRGDEAVLSALVFKGFHESDLGKKLYQPLFAERNQKMFATVTSSMKRSQRIFLVVGIGHMLGEDGLVRLFETAGYSVTRITAENAGTHEQLSAIK